MIPVRGYKGHQVAVLGLGRSGLSAAKALEAGGATALCWDDNEAARNNALVQGLTLFDLGREGDWGEIITLILSPGIPHLYPKPNPIVQKAWEKGVAVDNDIGLFFRSFASEDWEKFDLMPKVVAITGSNGKSTTSALAHHILKENNRHSQLGGNIGRGVLDLDPPGDGEVFVLELSSYQTDLARSLSPDIAVFLNLSPDHLDRHSGPGGYFAAKRRLFAEGGPDRAIIGVDEFEGRYLANQMREMSGSGDPVIRISAARKLAGGKNGSKDWCVFANKGFLTEWRNGRQVASIDLRDIAGLPGAHNHQNACAAYASARTLGLAPKAVEKALRTYPGLPHRSQVLGQRNGVQFVNDSKATNVESAARALQAFKSIRWIAGGEGKEGGIGDLAKDLKTVAKAYLIGDAAEDFATQLGETPFEICKTMKTAVAKAASEAVEGDTILLAPAAASFDQYDSFEERGDDFAAQVQVILAQK